MFTRLVVKQLTSNAEGAAANCLLPTAYCLLLIAS